MLEKMLDVINVDVIHEVVFYFLKISVKESRNFSGVISSSCYQSLISKVVVLLCTTEEKYPY